MECPQDKHKGGRNGAILGQGVPEEPAHAETQPCIAAISILRNEEWNFLFPIHHPKGISVDGGNAGLVRQGCGCPGTAMKEIRRNASSCVSGLDAESCLSQWPVQIKLMPLNAPYYDNADLLIAADCTAYAYASFHERFIKGRITLVGCPKLDGVDYAEKLSLIFSCNSINSIVVVRMEVPCCGGLEMAVRRAIEQSGKRIKLDIVTISTEGKII